MPITITILLVLFGLGVSIPEVLRNVNPENEPISEYLTGRWSWMERLGFVCMCVAIGLAHPMFPNFWSGLMSIFVIIALVLVVLTKAAPEFFGPNAEEWHLTSAAVVFVSGFVMEIFASHGALLNALTYLLPVTVGSMYLLNHEDTAWQEKVAVLMLMLWFLAFVWM